MSKSYRSMEGLSKKEWATSRQCIQHPGWCTQTVSTLSFYFCYGRSCTLPAQTFLVNFKQSIDEYIFFKSSCLFCGGGRGGTDWLSQNHLPDFYLVKRRMKFAGQFTTSYSSACSLRVQGLIGDHAVVRHGFQDVGLIGLKKAGLRRSFSPPFPHFSVSSLSCLSCPSESHLGCC